MTYSSSTLCSGATVSFDKIKISAPFSIVAVGNKDALQTFLDTQANQVKTLKTRKCFVEVEPVYNAKLPGSTNTISPQYLVLKKN